MKKNNPSTFFILLICGTLFLLPNFFNNNWNAVDPAYYNEWQIRYDRLVIARLVETRQNGFLSNGGLLGLGDANEWNFLSATHQHQYNSFLNESEFQSYLVYKSNPGFQGFVYGFLDNILSTSGAHKILSFRALTAFLSALTLGAIFAFITCEIGFLAGIFTLLFSAVSIWIVLPSSSIFWNLWVFYAPLITCTYLLAKSTKVNKHLDTRVYALLFTATLAKILLSGFDLMTTVLVMSTAPITFYGILGQWGWKTYIERFVKISVVLSAATLAGLTIMSFQISAAEGNTGNVFDYIENRVGSHFAGNSEYYLSGNIQATKIGLFELIGKYLAMPAINFRLPGPDAEILYWQLIVLFFIFTALYFLFFNKRESQTPKAIALIGTTWYSILAPLSWLVIFRPHSIIHTHVNTMGWQMPFTLLGFALCGFVISELYGKIKT